MQLNRWIHWPLIAAVAMITMRSHGATKYAQAQLRVTGPDAAACGSVKALAAAVEGQLQRPVFDGKMTDLIVTVVYRRGRGGFEAEVQLAIPDGKALGARHIRTSAPQCAALAEPLALAVAVMVDLTREDVVARQNSTESPAESIGFAQRPSDESEPSIPRAAAPATRGDERQGWDAAVFISGLATIGSLPGIGWGGRLASDLRVGKRISVELGVDALHGSTVTDGPKARASFVTYAPDLEICALSRASAQIDWRVCSGMQIEIMRAQGVGYITARTQQTVEFEPLVKLDSTWWPTQYVGIRVGLGAVGMLVRHQYYATRPDGTRATLFESTVVAPFLIFGVGLRS